MPIDADVWRLYYIDGENLGEKEFLDRFSGRVAGQEGEAPPRLIMHGSGTHTEQMLQGQGLFLDKVHGMYTVSSNQEARIVERSIRQANQKLVSVLTEKNISAVSVQGVDRGLFTVDADVDVQVHDSEWIWDLARQRVVPVISALGTHTASQRICELPAWKATISVLRAAPTDEWQVVCFTTTNQPGVRRDGQIQPRLSADEVIEEGVVADAEGLRALVDAGFPVVLTSCRGLSREGELKGTEVIV